MTVAEAKKYYFEKLECSDFDDFLSVPVIPIIGDFVEPITYGKVIRLIHDCIIYNSIMCFKKKSNRTYEAKNEAELDNDVEDILFHYLNDYQIKRLRLVKWYKENRC